MAKTTTSLASISMTGEQRAACFVVSVILHRVITENFRRSQDPLHADHDIETSQVKFPTHSKTRPAKESSVAAIPTLRVTIHRKEDNTKAGMYKDLHWFHSVAGNLNGVYKSCGCPGKYAGGPCEMLRPTMVDSALKRNIAIINPPGLKLLRYEAKLFILSKGQPQDYIHRYLYLYLFLLKGFTALPSAKILCQTRKTQLTYRASCACIGSHIIAQTFLAIVVQYLLIENIDYLRVTTFARKNDYHQKEMGIKRIALLFPEYKTDIQKNKQSREEMMVICK
ncbi:hypothetical protein BTVI_78473 [Pitangus sulphuratus]|nr:hypothetical protein BTVI_78473 [Pitangus sulphuratus]